MDQPLRAWSMDGPAEGWLLGCCTVRIVIDLIGPNGPSGERSKSDRSTRSERPRALARDSAPAHGDAALSGPGRRRSAVDAATIASGTAGCDRAPGCCASDGRNWRADRGPTIAPVGPRPAPRAHAATSLAVPGLQPKPPTEAILAIVRSGDRPARPARCRPIVAATVCGWSHRAAPPSAFASSPASPDPAQRTETTDRLNRAVTGSQPSAAQIVLGRHARPSPAPTPPTRRGQSPRDQALPKSYIARDLTIRARPKVDEP